MSTNKVAPSKIDWRVIDWMRGLAALYVVLNHSRGFLFSDAMHYADAVNPKANWNLWEWASMLVMQHTDLGAEFVILFFILSGFSIAHSLQANDNLKQFYTKRFVRLYPPYALGIAWAMIIFTVIKVLAPRVYALPTEGYPPLSIDYQRFQNYKAIVSNLLYAPNNNYLTPQYWSLPLEVAFYLIAPWIVKNLKGYGILTLVFYLAGWVWMKYSYFDTITGPFVPMYVFDYNIYFLVGIFLYKFREPLMERFKLNSKWSLLCLLFLFEVTVVSKSYLFHQIDNKVTGLLMMLFTTVLLLAGLKYTIRIKPLEKIGKFSYTLYVTHVATIFLVKLTFYKLGYNFHNINLLWAWYFGIAAALLFGYGFYYICEYPTIKYLQRFRSSRSTTYKVKTTSF